LWHHPCSHRVTQLWQARKPASGPQGPLPPVRPPANFFLHGYFSLFLIFTGSVFSNVVTNAEAIAAFGGDDHEAHIVQSRFDALTNQISRVTSIRFRFGMIEDFIVK
jgi:hypothetical protein